MIDNEYSSEEDGTTKDDEEIQEISKAINQRETKYVFDANDSANEDPSVILTQVKRAKESEREEDR